MIVRAPRKDLSVLVHEDEYIEWKFRGKSHRDGGPAVVRSNGTQERHRNGELPRHEKEDDSTYVHLPPDRSGGGESMQRLFGPEEIFAFGPFF